MRTLLDLQRPVDRRLVVPDKAEGVARRLGPVVEHRPVRPQQPLVVGTPTVEVLPPVMRTLSILSAAMALLLGGCGGPRMDVSQMTSARPVDLQSASAASASPAEYRIGIGDKLDVTVFQVPDLSFEDLVVDASGNIQMPLIGAVAGAGRTARDMSADIGRRLSERYLQNAEVTVTVVEAASQKITVDGAVAKPGVYEMRGSTSLLQAVAMAEGPTQLADLSKVAVFRTVDGQRSVAVFDLGAIRQGRATDPEVRGDDVIVVDTSRLNATLREIVTAIPALALFRPY